MTTRPSPRLRPAFTLVELPAMSRGKRGAFTLVELLVVIGIIAVLIGILLPVLSSARRTANITKCSSALRQIAYAFTMYSKENRDMYPVIKWERPDLIAKGFDSAKASNYWQDFLLPYAARNNAETRDQQNATSSDPASQAQIRIKKSVFWGCPNWAGSRGGQNEWLDQEGISLYDTGYCMNPYPFFTRQTGGYSTWKDQTAMDAKGNIQGKWYNYRKWSPYADKCLVIENTFWYLMVVPTDPAAAEPRVQPQPFSGRTLPTQAGGNNIDRYRHGKYPRNDGTNFLDNGGGQVKLNILYGDGHVDLAINMKTVYKSFILRDP